MPDANVTKKALADSMKQLMKEKPFEKISVTDICEHCGMNRKSFYYHFKDKYDLVNWIYYTEFIMMAGLRQFGSAWDLLEAVADLFYSNQVFYRRALEIEGQNSFRDYFSESTAPIFILFANRIVDAKEAETAAGYMADAFLVIMYRWLREGCPGGPEAFTFRIRSIIEQLGAEMRKDPSGI